MVGLGDGAWLLSVPRSFIHRLRVGQGPAVLAVGVGVSCLDYFIFSVLSTFFLSSPTLSRRRLDKNKS